MSNYTKTTNFATKDALASGNPAKIVKGTEIDTEFNNIATAVATKSNTADPTFTGTVTAPVVVASTSINIAGDGATVTGIKDEDDMASNSATKLATQQSIKAYVDSQVTAQDLDVTDGTTSISIDLDSEALSLLGGTGIDSTASGNGVTMAIDSTVATLTGTQTLTNKTLTSPDVNTPDIDGGTIDGTVIGGTTAAAGSFTTVGATGNITVGGTVDGRDVATDGAKLDGIEAGATADQTAAEIKTAYESNANTNAFTDADESKLDGIEALADVTDTANVTAAGALMDSELTSITAVKALDQGVATTDSPTFAAATVTGEITANGGIALGDNDKATFGASDDLQIYHDGSNSYIADTGTGGLRLLADADTAIRSADNSTAKAIFGGDVKLYHSGNLKLATTATGIDVTGTATMDGLTVAGSATSTFNSGSENLVATFTSTDTEAQINLVDTTGSAQIRSRNDFRFYVNGGSNRAMDIASNGDISFYEDTGTTAKFFWDASAESLTVGGDDSTTATSLNTLVLGEYADASSGAVLRSSAASAINFEDSNASTAGRIYYNHTSDYMAFNTAASERMRIDSSGNVYVGTTSSTPAFGTGTGMYLSPTGESMLSGGNNTTLFLNRTTGDGSILDFRKNGSQVGSIGSASGAYLHIGSGDVGLRFDGSNDRVMPVGNASNLQATRDAAVDLGAAAARFKDLYLSGGVYLGGTGAANKLEDYEEGTWTATIADASTGGNTTSTYTGRYTKIGNLVTVFCALTNIDTTGLTAGNVMYVQGLPFTSNANNQTVGTCKVDTVNLISRTYIYANMGGNDSWLNFQTGGSNISEANIDPQHITSGTSDIQFTLQYIV